MKLIFNYLKVNTKYSIFILLMKSNSLKNIAPDYDLVLKSLKDVVEIKKADNYDE